MPIAQLYAASALIVLAWSLTVRAPWRETFVATLCGPVTLFGVLMAVFDSVNDA